MTDEEGAINDPGVLNNPAARLQYWLELGRQRARIAYDDQQAHQHTQGGRTEPFQMLDVWCQIWGLAKNDRADRIEYTRRAVGMIDAGVEARRLAEASTNFMAPASLEHFYEVERALNYFMDAPTHDINTVMNQIQPTGWHSLKLLDSLLRNEAPQPSLDGSQVTDLVKRTQDLIRTVMDATDLTEQDRLLVAEKLQEVETALMRARITGTADVMRSVDGLMGGMMRLYLRGVDIMNHPAAKAVWALAGAIVALLGVGADVTQIVTGPFAALLGLPAPENAGSAPAP